MACLKCGSDWVTATGKNCASCPHCCKLAKCRERKSGRWIDVISPRQCIRCNSDFTPSSIQRNHATICPKCKASHRKEWRKQWTANYRKHGATNQQLHGRPMPRCCRCSKKCADRRHTHCSRHCYNADRKEGLIEWDMTGQQLGNLQKRRAQGLAMPSEVMYAAIQQAMRRHCDGILNLHKQLNAWRPCLHCGGPLKDHATKRTMFCSIPCAAAFEHQIKCRLCGEQCVKRGMQGGRGMCMACKRIADKANSRKGYRRKLTKICRRDGWRCQLCSCRLLKTWKLDSQGVPHPRCRTLDHILPRAEGGTDHDWNLQACCFKCNYEKGKKHRGQLRFAM